MLGSLRRSKPVEEARVRMTCRDRAWELVVRGDRRSGRPASAQHRGCEPPGAGALGRGRDQAVRLGTVPELLGHARQRRSDRGPGDGRADRLRSGIAQPRPGAGAGHGRRRRPRGDRRPARRACASPSSVAAGGDRDRDRRRYPPGRGADRRDVLLGRRAQARRHPARALPITWPECSFSPPCSRSSAWTCTRASLRSLRPYCPTWSGERG